MRNFTVYDVPLKLYTAESKAEALELVDTSLMRQGGYLNLAVAFVDVVMETDSAGLELCRYIREDLKDKFTVLYVRTGQPGVAPERTVIDRYDISGYFTKVEATEDKLYSLVKSGVRQYYSSGVSFALSQMLHRLIVASGSREQMAQTMSGITSAHQVDATGKKFEGASYKNWMIADGKVIAGGEGGDESEALELKARLDQLPGTPLSEEGDKFAVDGSSVLIKIAETSETAEFHEVMRTTFPPPDFIVFSFYRFLKSFATLWRQAS
jgi:CheY-like chemotaxis protein